MGRTHVRRSVVATFSVALVACNGILGPDDEGSRLGVISFYQDPIVIDVPETVERGQVFVVTVRTYGGGCITEGPTDALVENLHATVTPYDIHSGSDLCTLELRRFEHKATLRFDRAGTATVIVRGTRVPEDRTVIEERTVVVN